MRVNELYCITKRKVSNDVVFPRVSFTELSCNLTVVENHLGHHETKQSPISTANWEVMNAQICYGISYQFEVFILK